MAVALAGDGSWAEASGASLMGDGGQLPSGRRELLISIPTSRKSGILQCGGTGGEAIIRSQGCWCLISPPHIRSAIRV